MNDDSLLCHHALPGKTLLNHVYVIDEILGEGGFGITYGAYHKDNGSHVAIKEYFPHTIAVRTTRDGVLWLRPFPEKNREEYDKGQRRFLGEAKILRELQYLDSIVSVYDFFEENGTAYIVMEYIEGLTLGQFVEENGPLSFSELLHLMAPVIQSLAEIHSKGLIHRDISPDNLILGTDNKLHLLDFGAASFKNTANSHGTVILKAGYAPPEQYISGGKIGAWIDVYALCATMYFALTGHSPSEAMERLEQDSRAVLSEPEGLLPWQWAAIEKGLQLRSANRFHDMEELYYALVYPPDTEEEATRRGSRLSPRISKKVRRLNRPRKARLLSLAAAACLLLAIAALWAGRVANPDPADPALPSASPVPVAAASPTPDSEAPGAASPATEGMTSSTTEGMIPSSSVPEPAHTANQVGYTQTELLSMPDLTKLTLREAKKILRKLDPSIKVSTIYSYHDDIAPHHIIAQSVAKDTLFSKGHLSSVLLTASKGKKAAEKVSSGQTPASANPPAAPKKKKQDSGYQVRPDDDYEAIHMD